MVTDNVAKEEVVIRPYKKEDRQAIRKICCDTAFMGEPMEIFFDDREVLADILTSYYTDFEPESIFVADFKGEVIGYLIGCTNMARKDKIFAEQILPKIIFAFIRKGLLFKKKTSGFLFHTITSFFKEGSKKPRIPKEYPAVLHINIDKDFRRSGLGCRLMNAYFGYLRKHNIFGVNLSTFSEQGRNFFLKMGFTLLGEGKTSRWRYILNRDIKTYTFGKLIKEG